MKTLYMVRHAKSSWKHDVIDHQRPLKGRGKRDGALVSNYLKDKIDAPDKIISSDAVRAMTTAKYFKKALGVKGSNFELNAELYDFGGSQVMKVINGLSDSWDTVMIVGHNHAFTSIANMLGSKYIDNLPTCGFVKIEFEDKSWKNLGTGKTTMTIFPRDLK